MPNLEKFQNSPHDRCEEFEIYPVFDCEICFVEIYAIFRVVCFVAIYALLCGEKLNRKLCLWRKKTNIRYVTTYHSNFSQRYYVYREMPINCAQQ